MTGDILQGHHPYTIHQTCPVLTPLPISSATFSYLNISHLIIVIKATLYSPHMLNLVMQLFVEVK